MPTALTLLLVCAAPTETVDTALVAQTPVERVAQAIREALPVGTTEASVMRWLRCRGAELQKVGGTVEASVALLFIPPGRGSLSLPSDTVVVILRFRGGLLIRLSVTSMGEQP